MGRHRRRIEDHLLRSVLANRRCQPKRLTPHFEDVQSHCDLPDEFFRLGWTRHSCAYLDDLLSKVNRDQAIAVTDEATAGKLMRLMDALEDLDDVTNTYSNFDIAPEVLEKLD